MQLALKRAGTQPFQDVAALLRTLDRPEAFLQQAAAAPPVKKSYPVLMEESASSSLGGDPADQETIRTMVQEVVQEIVPWQDSEQKGEEEEYESNEDFDSEG